MIIVQTELWKPLILSNVKDIANYELSNVLSII